MYLEGPDQYRGWFHSSLLVAVGVKDAAPYRHVLTHGWALDEKGAPMHKTLGNAIYPKEICEKWGADLLRLWVVSLDYHADVRMSERVMTQLSESYRKIRNTFRWVLGNLDKFDPAQHAVADGELVELDRYMLQRTAELVEKCRGWYDEFEFHRVFHAIHDFCVVDLSAFYFDVLKDRLYTFARYNAARRSGQTAIYRIAHALLRLLAPMLVFATEEIWKHFPHRAGEPESIHMALWPQSQELVATGPAAGDTRWPQRILAREAVLKVLEEARSKKEISASLEAKITVSASGTALEALEEYKTHLPALFIVSQVDLARADGAQPAAPLQVKAAKAEGAKCERCWNYSTRVGESAEWPTVCERCVAALEEIKSYGDAGPQESGGAGHGSGAGGQGPEAAGRGAR